MPKFLCLQRSLPSATPAEQRPSPAQMQEMYAKFGAWREQFKDQLVDMGGKLGQGRLVAAEPAPDGPYVEVKELVGGYMIVQAQDLEGAIEVARACPGLVRPGSGVEVVEIHTP
ncbi:MAG: YciI family protein [Myxococcota bacterium]